MTNEDRAVGALLEFKAPGTFEPTTDRVGGGPFRLRAGEWTDDTTDAHLTPYESRLAKAAEMRRLDLRRIDLPIPDRGVIDDVGYDQIVVPIDEHRSIEQRLVELRAGTRKAHRGCPQNHHQVDVIRRRAGR